MILINHSQKALALKMTNEELAAKNFEKTGLITRKSDKGDLRKTLINLTPAGWEKFDQLSPEAERIYFAIEEKVGKQELNQLLKSLQKLNTKLHIEN